MSSKLWQCVDGSYKSSYFSCSSSSLKCYGTDDTKQYYCGRNNGDYCAFSDVYCMRKCGTTLQNVYTYDSPCAGRPGMCSWLSLGCPLSCGDGQVVCPSSNRCEKTLAFCDACWDYRCANSGKCIGSYKECDGVNDCGDNSDELYCGSSGSNPSSGGDVTTETGVDSTTPVLIGVCISIGVLVAIVVCIICMVRKRRRNRASRGAVLSTRQPGGQPTGGPTIVGATPIASPPRIAGATNPYGSNSRLVPPAQTPYTLVPTAPGSTRSLNSASSQPSAAPPPSYDEVLDNETRFRKADTELPSYADSEHIPPVNPHYTSTSAV